MKASAVICEFNPMHEGHESLLRRMREAFPERAILCLMSGDFVQRGEPAVFDKYTRARTAVLRGADLVLELPYPWSCAVAGRFAAGAVSILCRIGGVETLFFGSEGKDEAQLSLWARRLCAPEFTQALQALRRTERSLSYPRLIDRCCVALYGSAPGLLPNEILGVHYLQEAALRQAPFSVRALPLLPGFSASSEREKLRRQGVPAALLSNGEQALLALLTLTPGQGRFSSAAARCAGLADLFAAVRTPEDTDSRLRRELIASVLHAQGAENGLPGFTTLLAANERGLSFLASVRKSRRLPVITRPARLSSQTDPESARLYAGAARLYARFLPEPVPADGFLRQRPYIAGKNGAPAPGESEKPAYGEKKT